MKLKANIMRKILRCLSFRPLRTGTIRLLFFFIPGIVRPDKRRWAVLS